MARVEGRRSTRSVGAATLAWVRKHSAAHNKADYPAGINALTVGQIRNAASAKAGTDDARATLEKDRGIKKAPGILTRKIAMPVTFPGIVHIAPRVHGGNYIKRSAKNERKRA